MEIWKDIEGYKNLYQISNLGNVKSLGNDKTRKEKILKTRKHYKDGYLLVGLNKQGKAKVYLVHRLVGRHFIPNPKNLPQLNHRNEIRTDNRVENLEWCDCQYNIDYSLSKQVLCVETGKIYPSMSEVYRQLGFAQSAISRVCNGKRKTAYGYTWRYV